MNKKPIIGIIGGTGRFGGWFKRFFEDSNLKVIIAGSKTEIKKEDLAKKADIVIISVPINKTVEIIDSISHLVKKDALLCDFTSVKIEPVQAMLKSKSGVTGLHPLFGPLVPNLKDQNIVFCSARDNIWTEYLEKLFKKNGARIIKVTPEEHDLQMAVVQSLTHFINISLLRTLYTQKNKSLGLMSTPVFRLQSLIMGRIAAQNPELYADIEIHNPMFKKVLKDFKQNVEEISNDVEKNNSKNFIKKFIESSEYLNEFIKVAEFKSGEILNSLKDQSVPVKTATKKEIKNSTTVAYLGPEGTFSHQGAEKIFTNSKTNFIPASSITEVFRMVNHNETEYGVVPIENSITGLVRETIRGLIDFPVLVNGSYDFAIHHYLMSRKNINKKDIKTIKSHPQVLSQCRQWLENNIPNIKLEAVSSSAKAITKNSNDKIAFIGSSILAQKYNLKILAKNIEDQKGNTTKFYVISNSLDTINKSDDRQKTLLLLAVYDRVGVLRDILNVFADNDINLSRLHSIPSQIKKWDYYFFIELEDAPESKKIKKSIHELEPHCTMVRVLGRG